jgi:hypothetical protein
MDSKPTLTRGQANQAYAPILGASPSVSAPLPSGLGWDTTNWPLNIGLQVSAVSGRAFGTLGTGSFDITSNAKYIACLAGSSFYVDYATGNDANPGTSGSKVKSIWAAQALLNATGNPGVIYITAGTYGRSYNFCLGTTANLPTVDTMYVATGGRVVVTSHDQGLTWTADGTYTNCYGSSSLTAAPARVLDIANRDAYGLWPDFAKANSAAECNAKPWTYFWDGTSKLYVNRGDGLTVSTSTNTWVLRTLPNFQYSGAYQRSFFFMGATTGDGFDLVGAANAGATTGALSYSSGLTITAATASAGTITCTVSSTSTMTTGQSCKIVGSTGLAFDGTYTATVASGTTFTVPSAATGTYTGSSGSVCQNYSRTNVVYAKGCSFRYAGYYNGSQNGNGVGTNNFGGTSVFINCDASGNGSDGFNFHDTRYFGHQALAVNCTGLRNGLVGSTSNNGWTSHEDVVGIDVAGDYWASAGYTVHTIDSGKTFLVGTVACGARGDKIFGGSFDPGEFRVSNTATMWCFATLALPTSGSGYAYAASDTSTIYYRSLRPYFGSVVKDSGATFTAY